MIWYNSTNMSKPVQKDDEIHQNTLEIFKKCFFFPDDKAIPWTASTSERSKISKRGSLEQFQTLWSYCPIVVVNSMHISVNIAKISSCDNLLAASYVLVRTIVLLKLFLKSADVLRRPQRFEKVSHFVLVSLSIFL